MIFVGELNKRKGFPDFLDIASAMNEREFIAVGKWNLSYKKPRLNNVVFLGELDNKEVIKHYDYSDILIFPSYDETFGRVILEAMARGLCIITTTLPAIKEYFINDKNGYMVSPGDIKSIMGLIEYLDINRDKIKEISKNNLKYVKNFSPDNQGAIYLELIDSLQTNKLGQ